MRARHAMLPLLLLLAGCADPVGKGAVVLLFVSPTCPIANRTAPELSRVAARFAGRARFSLV
jgi:hypothetical protein